MVLGDGARCLSLSGVDNQFCVLASTAFGGGESSRCGRSAEDRSKVRSFNSSCKHGNSSFMLLHRKNLGGKMSTLAILWEDSILQN